MESRSMHRWALVWGSMLVAAFAIGVITRVSYEDVSAHPEKLDGLPYQAGPFSQEQFEQYADGMGDAGTLRSLKEAELVVRVQKGGASAYRYKAFTTPVKVVEVMRGDALLQGSSISVYEPVSLTDWGGAEFLVAADAYQFGCIPMREDEEYVLFLNRAPANDVVGDAWTFALSSYAKLTADGDPVCVIHAGGETSMSLLELNDADVVVESDEDAAAYLAGCEDVLESLGVEG